MNTKDTNHLLLCSLIDLNGYKLIKSNKSLKIVKTQVCYGCSVHSSWTRKWSFTFMICDGILINIMSVFLLLSAIFVILLVMYLFACCLTFH